MPIPWTDDFSVNVKEIDDQHKKFLGMLNSLYIILHKAEYGSELKEILQELKAYKEFHFATEEKYFAMFNYELTEEHKEEHQKLSLKVEEFISRFNNGDEDILFDLLNFLEDWLVIHLNNQDKKYTKCFNDHGLF